MDLLRYCEINPGPTRRERDCMGPWKEFNLARVLDHQTLTDYNS